MYTGPLASYAVWLRVKSLLIISRMGYLVPFAVKSELDIRPCLYEPKLPHFHESEKQNNLCPEWDV